MTNSSPNHSTPNNIIQSHISHENDEYSHNRRENQLQFQQDNNVDLITLPPITNTATSSPSLPPSSSMLLPIETNANKHNNNNNNNINHIEVMNVSKISRKKPNQEQQQVVDDYWFPDYKSSS
jgi:hypothetical protein